MGPILLAATTAPDAFHALSSWPGESNGGYEERKKAWFRCDEPGQWELFIDEAPAHRMQTHDHTMWEWTPGFHAGTVLAELSRLDQRGGTRFLLDVSPDPSKLGQDIFLRMLEEVWTFDGGLLLGIEPASLSVGWEGSTSNPGIRLARILRNGKRFVAALAIIASDPQRATRQSRLIATAAGLRRADAQTIRNSFNSSACLTLAPSVEDQDPGHGAQAYFNIPFSETNLDNAGNRTLLAIVQRTIAYTQRVLEAFEQEVRSEEQDELNTGLRDRWPRRRETLERFLDALSHFRRCDPLAAVTRAEMSAEGLTSMGTNPKYANARQIAWSILRPGVNGLAHEEMPWMSPTWHVYEAWCMTRLFAAIKAELPEMAWESSMASGWQYRLQGNKGGKQVNLYYQPRFKHSAGPDGNQGMASISATYVPDIVLTMEDRDGFQWLVLDAKYSCSRRSILQQMSTAHIYHDALRWKDQPPSRCLLLVPGMDWEGGWLHEPAFQGKHGVGIAAFTPDNGFEREIAHSIQQFFPD